MINRGAPHLLSLMSTENGCLESFSLLFLCVVAMRVVEGRKKKCVRNRMEKHLNERQPREREREKERESIKVKRHTEKQSQERNTPNES
jgi:hypothetical protein